VREMVLRPERRWDGRVIDFTQHFGNDTRRRCGPRHECLFPHVVLAALCADAAGSRDMSRGSTQDAGGNAYSMVRYLLSKQPLDDRSLNSHVLRALSDWLGKQHSPRILEIGAGVGTMITRLVSANALSRGHYALLDADAHSLAAAREHLTEWALARQLVALSTEGELGLQLRGADVDISVEFIEADAARFCVSDGQPGFDLLVANSVLDLMDLNVALPALWRLCNPHAAYWFTLDFVG